MTLIGYWLHGPEHATIWADTQCFLTFDQSSAGNRLKLAVNVMSGVVSVSAGYGRQCDAAAEIVRAAETFDDMLYPLTERLREVSEIPVERRRGEWLEGGTTLAVGYSHKYGRIVGAVFNDKNGFFPEFRGSHASPRCDGIESLHPQDDADLIGYALAQMRVLRERVNSAAGLGVLTVAEVRPDAIIVRPIFNFANGKPISRPCTAAESNDRLSVSVSVDGPAADDGNAAGQLNSEKDTLR